LFLIGCPARAIKNPRPFPAVGFVEIVFHARQAATASPTTTTASVICRTSFIYGAQGSDGVLKGQASFALLALPAKARRSMCSCMRGTFLL
jgi:hypothetical protein